MEDLGKDVGGEVHLWGILGEREYLVCMNTLRRTGIAVHFAFH
jgi:hypothetical protein